MFFVDDVDLAVDWYRRVLDGSIDHSGLPTVVAGDVQLGFHPADPKRPAGVGGSVTYCSVDSLDPAIERFADNGAAIYRGPLRIEDGRRLCQLRDPYGNVLGLVGA